MIVIDSSAVIDVLGDAPGSGAIRERFAGEILFAPHALDVEVLAVVRNLIVGGKISAAFGQQLITDYGDLPVTRWQFARDLQQRALQLRDNVSGYDAAFVTLAESLQCPLVTRDRRLARSSGHDVKIEAF